MFTAHAARGFIYILPRPPPQSSAKCYGEGADLGRGGPLA